MTQVTIDQAIQIALQHHRAGLLGEAEGIYRQILAQHPEHANALHLLGALAYQTGNLDAAIDLEKRALAANPNLAEAHNNLGNALRDKGDYEGAIACHTKSIELKPDLTDAHYNLGIAFYNHGRSGDAVLAYRRALELRPDFASAHFNLGIALMDQTKIEEAIASYRRAIQFAPDHAPAYNNLANALKDDGRIEEAVAAYRSAVAIDPAMSRFHSNLCFALHYHPEQTPMSLLEEHREWNRRHAQPIQPKTAAHENDRSPDRKLRIGYISPDFRDHPAGRMAMPLLEHRDSNSFEIFCYSASLKSDPFTLRMQKYSDNWRNVTTISDDQAAEMIINDRIDILVDLAAHTADNRLLVLARKPAPLQVAVFPGTTGMERIDYRLTDIHFDPPGSEGDYAEQLMRVRSYWCFEPRETPPVNSLPALDRGYVTFGCLNYLGKINSMVLDLWIGVMRAVSESRIILKADGVERRDEIQKYFESAGIQRERIDFVGKRSLQGYFELNHGIDIGLDPVPFNGHTTTFDFLWMGVPVITLTGQTCVGRAGASVLSNLGMPELIARTTAEYISLAAKLARDLPALVKIRSTLRQRMLDSPLMDAPGYVRDIESTYRSIWRKWCHG